MAAFAIASLLVVAGIIILTTPGKVRPGEFWGQGSASDGRIEVTIDGHYWSTGYALGFDFLKNATPIPGYTLPYLVVNVTVRNVASYNQTVLPSFWAKVSDGHRNLTNTVLLNRASTPGQFPMPPTPLGSGQRLQGWMAFTFDIGSPTHDYRFIELMYVDFVGPGVIDTQPQIHVTPP